MNNIGNYEIKDSETQLYTARDEEVIECEMYGRFSYNGIIFERDLKNPRNILTHITDGVKIVSEFLHETDNFFRKGTDHWYMHYRDCDDYVYSDKPTELSDSAIERIIKRYVYLYHPKLEGATSLGWDRGQGELRNPNIYDGIVQLDDKKYYRVTRYMDTVGIKLIKDLKAGITKENLEPVVGFKLDAVMYQKALDFSAIKGKIRQTLYNKLEDSTLIEYMGLKRELTKFTDNIE